MRAISEYTEAVSDFFKGNLFVGAFSQEEAAMEQKKSLKENAQALRKHMTKEEAQLWYQFLCRAKHRFRRQYVIGNYIADFYCHAAKLVVELDGSQHCSPEERDYDEKRTAYLESLGLKVVRFSNLDVMRRFRDVCEAIYSIVEERAERKL